MRKGQTVESLLIHVAYNLKTRCIWLVSRYSGVRMQLSRNLSGAFRTIAALVLLAPGVVTLGASWREQVEADWLRQDAKRLQPAAEVTPVTPQQDAAGAVDGVKEGKWGFHTEFEENPWWEVDLGQVLQLGRLIVYNRGDGYSERTAFLKVLVASEDRQFREAYRHEGKIFHGTAGEPLKVSFNGLQARYFRLTIPGRSYFHLDEVELYAVGCDQNVAFGKPATQSSVSQWSFSHKPVPGASMAAYPISLVVERGLKLAASQKRLGMNTDSGAGLLLQLAEENQRLKPEQDEALRRDLYFRARWTVREMALRNPLLDFESILFVKRAPGMFPHMSDQHYGWWSRPGGGLFLLENFKQGEPKTRSLTGDMPAGSFASPDLSFDAKKLVFAYCRHHSGLADEPNKADKSRVPETAFYHIFEMNADGSARHQLTHGKYDDFDPRYLPNGDILFLSTRKGTAIQCSQWFSDSTRGADHPDSYVRCGGDNYRPVPVFTLHAMDASGANLRPLSAFENFEWTPSVANDGRILYTRWDYIDRFNGHFFSLWSANQDGSNPQLVYGNYTVRPQVKFEARAIPGSDKIIFTAGAHHSNAGGTLCLLDRTRGTEGDGPLTRLTPEVRFPETEADDQHYFASPWPISEEYFLVGWADSKLPPHGRFEDARNPRNAMGIYLLDAFGNLELLYRDPEISSVSPVPVKARPRPPVQPELAQRGKALEGRMLVQDVYRGLEGVPRGAVRHLRLVAVPPKVQPHMNNPVLGVSAEDPGKFVLGTVPVEADGSAFFRVPSGVAVFFQALDSDGVAVQTMRTLTYAMPGQTLSCVGCHEPRDTAPVLGPSPLAARRPPSPIRPGPDGSWPLRFDKLVQPVLDRHCVRCHSASGKETHPQAARFDLSPAKAYESLLTFGEEDLKKQAFERDRSVPNETVTARSRLWKWLHQAGGHQQLVLDSEDRERLATWMDTYAHRQGHFSPQQEQELSSLRHGLRHLLADR